jgi:hypothetical protein
MQESYSQIRAVRRGESFGTSVITEAKIEADSILG